MFHCSSYSHQQQNIIGDTSVGVHGDATKIPNLVNSYLIIQMYVMYSRGDFKVVQLYPKAHNFGERAFWDGMWDETQETDNPGTDTV